MPVKVKLLSNQVWSRMICEYMYTYMFGCMHTSTTLSLSVLAYTCDSAGVCLCFAAHLSQACLEGEPLILAKSNKSSAL